jgi:YHS domain-containing protein
MAAVSDLMSRIDAEFDRALERGEIYRADKLNEFQSRQQRLETLDSTLDQLREIWRPRLEALAKKFGERVDVRPHIEPGRRSATFEFQSELARIKLRFGVVPDADVRNLIFNYDLEVIPILMKFESHDELVLPLDAIDQKALAKWLDDRIVSFVQTYLSLHENQYYLRDHLVEDPIAKVRFPKYAAGATLECKGKTIYFIDEATLDEFEEQQAGYGKKN